MGKINSSFLCKVKDLQRKYSSKGGNSFGREWLNCLILGVFQELSISISHTKHQQLNVLVVVNYDTEPHLEWLTVSNLNKVFKTEKSEEAPLHFLVCADSLHTQTGVINEFKFLGEYDTLEGIVLSPMDLDGEKNESWFKPTFIFDTKTKKHKMSWSDGTLCVCPRFLEYKHIELSDDLKLQIVTLLKGSDFSKEALTECCAGVDWSSLI